MSLQWLDLPLLEAVIYHYLYGGCVSHLHCYYTEAETRWPPFPDIFKWIFLNEIIWITIKISLKFVPVGPINNIPALVQIMAWHQAGDKPLSGAMMVSLLTYICITRPQWVIHADGANTDKQDTNSWESVVELGHLINVSYLLKMYFKLLLTKNTSKKFGKIWMRNIRIYLGVIYSDFKPCVKWGKGWCTGNSLVTSELPSQRPVTQSFEVFFDLRLNKRLSKQSRRWWFQRPPHPLWHHCNGMTA